MNVISADTRISALIKANPAVIDAIAGINAHFRKLQNPFLRKFLAPRVTIAEAAKIGKCELNEFFERLKPLGFIIDYGTVKKETKNNMIQNTTQPYNTALDVRADIAAGSDPFKKIIDTVSRLKTEETLLLVNSFEPVPLIRILNDRGYSTHVANVGPDEVNTYITRTSESKPLMSNPDIQETSFEKVEQKYEGKLHKIDVRALPMPQPMVKILDHLETLEPGVALFVYHKKIPVYLLPELKEKQFSYVLRQVDDGVNLIIYRSNETT